MPAYLSQHNGFSCGTYSVINSIVALGGEADYDEVKRLAGTSKNGTSRQGVLKALTALGYRAIPYRTKSADNYWRMVRRHASTNPIIMLCDQNDHYITITGMIGDRVTVVDSGPYTTNGNEYGVFSYSKSELLERCLHRGRLYGVRVSR